MKNLQVTIFKPKGGSTLSQECSSEELCGVVPLLLVMAIAYLLSASVQGTRLSANSIVLVCKTCLQTRNYRELQLSSLPDFFFSNTGV